MKRDYKMGEFTDAINDVFCRINDELEKTTVSKNITVEIEYFWITEKLAKIIDILKEE